MARPARRVGWSIIKRRWKAQWERNDIHAESFKTTSHPHTVDGDNDMHDALRYFSDPGSDSWTGGEACRYQTGFRGEQTGARPLHMVGAADHQSKGQRQEDPTVSGADRSGWTT